MTSEARPRPKGGKPHSPNLEGTVFEPFLALQVGQGLDAAGELEYEGSGALGQWSCVLKVLHKPSGAARAIKIVRPELVETAELRALFDEGLERAAGIEGENAVHIIDMGQIVGFGRTGVNPWRYFSMDWVDGRTLKDLASGSGASSTFSMGGLSDKTAAINASTSALTPEQVFGYVGKATEAVAELHHSGIAHLDIRPEHFILPRGNRVRLVGHGLSMESRRQVEARVGANWRSSYFAPPELVVGDWDNVGQSCDVYQLAIMAYELFMGSPCSPWVGYEELCESLDFVPTSVDELILECMEDINNRPRDASEFLSRWRAAEEQFSENGQKNRVRPVRKARDVWQNLQSMTKLEKPRWHSIVGGCQRLLEEKPHLFPFGKIPTKQVQSLLVSARARLQERRRAWFDLLIEGYQWRNAAAWIEHLRGHTSTADLDELRVIMELGQLEVAKNQPEQRVAAHKRLMELLREPQLGQALRERAARALETAMGEPAPPSAAHPIPVITDVSGYPPVERFRISNGEESDRWRVVVGPSLRVGRGSWEEFGNHIDLRPTKREAAESSYTVALAQQISRAGHFEFRVGSSELEVFCMGTHGGVADDKPLKRGERAALAKEGRCVVSRGASELRYRVYRDDEDIPAAVSIYFSAGVGMGRKVLWVLRQVPILAIVEKCEVGGLLIPTPTGWVVEAAGEGLFLGDVPLLPGKRVPWSDGVGLVLPDQRRLERG